MRTWSGGPAAPSGWPGRFSDKRPRHAGSIAHAKFQCRTSGANGIAYLRERGWRSLLSLRDPAGPPLIAAVPPHAAGPPPLSECTCARTRPWGCLDPRHSIWEDSEAGASVSTRVSASASSFSGQGNRAMSVPDIDPLEDTGEFSLPRVTERGVPASASPATTLDLGARSDVGLKRPNNEDHYAVVQRSRMRRILLTNIDVAGLTFPPDEAHAMIVADGMGGEGFGELASELVLRIGWELSCSAP